MKRTVPEIIVGRPYKDWSKRHVFYLACLLSSLAGLICVSFLWSLNYLHPHVFLPWAFLLAFTPVYMCGIFFLVMMDVWGRVPKAERSKPEYSFRQKIKKMIPFPKKKDKPNPLSEEPRNAPLPL